MVPQEGVENATRACPVTVRPGTTRNAANPVRAGALGSLTRSTRPPNLPRRAPQLLELHRAREVHSVDEDPFGHPKLLRKVPWVQLETPCV